MLPRFKGAALTGAALLLLFGVVFWARMRPSPELAVAQPAAVLSAQSDPKGTIRDPLSPDRLVAADRAPREHAASWARARPAFQYSRSTAERGGIAPCATQDVDTSAFTDWKALSKGHFSAPRVGALDASGHFDLVIHLHGDELVRRELVRSQQRFVLYTLTLDPSQSYASLFSGSGLLSAIRVEIARELGEGIGREVHIRHMAVSAWSAGFTGIEAMLFQPEAKSLDAIVLIDGLHAPRDPLSFRQQLKPFVEYASRAVTGERFMLVTHSSIDPPGFASTTESAHYLVESVGGKPEAVRRADALGLELVEYYSRGDFHVRGYAGNDKADHCAQLALLRDAYGALGRRWAGLGTK